MLYKMTPERHRQLFGEIDDFSPGPGRKRHCKHCDGWHLLDAWPHNCATPEPSKRNRALGLPTVIPDVPEHVENGTVIGSRVEQREFMKRNDCVELEDFEETAGTHKQDFESHAYEAELVEDIKRSMELDPLSHAPPQMIEEANDDVSSPEEVIDTDSIEVIE